MVKCKLSIGIDIEKAAPEIRGVGTP